MIMFGRSSSYAEHLPASLAIIVVSGENPLLLPISPSVPLSSLSDHVQVTCTSIPFHKWDNSRIRSHIPELAIDLVSSLQEYCNSLLQKYLNTRQMVPNSVVGATNRLLQRLACSVNVKKMMKSYEAGLTDSMTKRQFSPESHFGNMHKEFC